MRPRRNEQRVEKVVVAIERIISGEKLYPDRVLARLGGGRGNNQMAGCPIRFDRLVSRPHTGDPVARLGEVQHHAVRHR